MFDLFKQYATDPKAEQEGKEFDFGGGVKMLIARSGNDKYTRMLNKAYEAHKHTLDLKDTPEQIAAGKELSHKIMADVMAHSILLGWSGPAAYAGAELPHSIENAQKLLLLKDFQVEVAKRSDDFRNFRYEVEEADAKNSLTSSSGNSPGEVALPISKD